MFRFFFLLLFFIEVIVNGQDAIKCHVKAGIGNKTTVNKGIKTCTSQMCLTFYDFSDNFWATNCFQIGTPLSLGRTFKQVATRNKKRPKSAYFYYCLSDNCNENPFITMNGQIKAIMIIMPDPISFDYKLFPSLGKEPPQTRQLQNAGYTLDNARNFVGGYVFPSTKNVFAQFQFNNVSNKIVNMKLNYNIPTATLTTTYGNVKSVKKLSNQYLPDEQYYIIFDVLLSPEGDYQISVNDENILKLPKSQMGDVTRASYGGKWKYVDSAGNYQISFPRSLAKNQSCSNPPNSKMTVIPINEYSNSELQIPAVSEGQSKSAELRSSLCPGSDMIRFDVSLIKHFNGAFFYHSSVYFRKKLQWIHMFTQIIPKTSTCSFITVTEYNAMTSFSCGNDIINQISSKYKISTFLKGYVANYFTLNNDYLYKQIKYLVY